MSFPKLGGLLVLTVAAVAWTVLAGRATSEPAAASVAQKTTPVVLPGVQGTASCSGRGCHGAVGSSADPHGREYTTWLLHDPHAKAFDVLLTERSQVMVKNLYPKDPQVRAETTELCLKCHGRAASAAQSPRVANGFGCESCHGAAEKWLDAHTDGPTWSKLTDQAKLTYGFRSMKQPQDCVQVCADCHIGTPAQEANHDLLAAGHPRIQFELQSYLAALPRHWPDGPTEKAPLHTWLVGQAATAEASLKLLAHRAEPQGKRPWPEFAEYDCYACHHGLKNDFDDQRLTPGYLGKRTPGTFPWNEWYCALPGVLAGKKGPFAADQLQGDLDGLRTLMEKPLPNRAEVAKQATKAADQLHKLLAALPAGTPAAPSSLFLEPSRLWIGDAKDPVVLNWDVAAQLTLALNAEYDQLAPEKKKTLDPAFSEALKKLYELLQFSREGNGAESPVDFKAKEFAKQWQETAKRLESAK